jgi:hypothetical protein
MRYLSKPSTFPIHTSGTDHNLIHTPGTFPNHLQSQSIHEVLSKPSTSPWCTPGTNHSLFCIPGTFPIHPPSQFVHKVPCHAIHNPILYVGYQAKPLQVNSHLIGWKTTTRHKIPWDNWTCHKMEDLIKDSSYMINDSTTNLWLQG